MIRMQIKVNESGKRIDVFLLDEISLSRNQIQKAIKNKHWSYFIWSNFIFVVILFFISHLISKNIKFIISKASYYFLFVFVFEFFK